MSGPAAPPAQQGQQVASFSNFDHKTPEMESRDFRDPYTRTRSTQLLFTFIIYFVDVIYLCQMPQAHGGLGLFDGIGKRRSCLG